jgi:hypothetical protein
VATDVERVLGGVQPHLMVTEPPYRVNYDPAWRNQAGRSNNGTTQWIATGTVIKPIGARAVGKVVNDDRADWREAWAGGAEFVTTVTGWRERPICASTAPRSSLAISTGSSKWRASMSYELRTPLNAMEKWRR